jgi:3-oxoacyl-[acyl-carrier protein] reductase
MAMAGQVALVTGASSGIGRGVAVAFGREGMKVAVNYPTGAEAAAAAAVCEEVRRAGGEAVAVRADVSEPAEVRSMVAVALERFGAPDVLVNNAGIATAAPVHEMPVEIWDRLVAVHLRGTFLVTREVLPHMYARGSGRIISTASQLAYKGAPGFAHYAAAKAGIVAFTRTVALEIGDRGININCVAPGATMTPMLADVPPELLEQIRRSIPLGRLAEVDDIVPTYLLLAGRGGRHYQGQCLSPNGGDVFL